MRSEATAVGRRLRLEWLALLAGGVVLLVAGAGLVGSAGAADATHRWLLVAGVVVAYEVAFVGYHLVQTRELDDLPGGSFGPANAVTMLRGLLYAATAGFLLVPPSSPTIRWAPGVCYGAGAALDAVDGYLARQTGRSSALGERLDHAFDTLGFLVAPLVGVVWGRLPVAYLTLAVARYAFRGGLVWRRRSGRSVHPLPESRLRRRLAAVQMAVIAVALPPVLPVELVHPAAILAMLPSIALFARDWLAVSGRLPRYEE